MLFTHPLDIRLSKAQVMAIAGNLHHDECGIKAMFTAMKQADRIGRYGNICRALFPPWADTDYSYRYANG